MTLTCGQLAMCSLLAVGGVAVIVAAAAPTWASAQVGDDVIDIGVYYGCKNTFTEPFFGDCKKWEWNLPDGLEDGAFVGKEDFFKIVRILMGVSEAFAIMCIVHSLRLICERERQECVKMPATCGILSGLAAVSALVVYYFWETNDLIAFNPWFKDDDSKDKAETKPEKFWAYWTCCGGAGWLVLLGLMACCVGPRQEKYCLEGNIPLEVGSGGKAAPTPVYTHTAAHDKF